MSAAPKIEQEFEVTHEEQIKVESHNDLIIPFVLGFATAIISVLYFQQLNLF